MQRSTTLRTVNNEPDGLRFVRMVCPYPMVAAGLARAMEEAGVRHGPRSPKGDTPDCVLLWADDAEGLPEAVEGLRGASPDAPILVLGLRNDMPLARAALRAGARGFVHAGMTPNQFVRALSVASRGEVVAPRELLEFLLKDECLPGEDPSENLDALSDRQRGILDLVAEGLSNAQIGKRFYLSESTIKQHLRTAYKRLGVANRTEATRLVRRNNAR